MIPNGSFMTHAMPLLLSLGLLVASNFTARSPWNRRQLVAADIPETLFYDTGAVAKQVCHGSCYAETTRQLLRYVSEHDDHARGCLAADADKFAAEPAGRRRSAGSYHGRESAGDGGRGDDPAAFAVASTT